MSMWMIAALLLAAPVAAEEPLAAAGKWRVDFGDSACTASRQFADADRKVEVLIERTPFGVGTSVFLVVDWKMAPKPIQGDVSLVGEPEAAVASDGAGLSNLAGGRRAIRLYLPADYTKTLSRATSLRVVGGGLRVPMLRLDGTAGLAGALDACERTFAKDLGIDTAALARIAVPATVIKPTDAFQVSDYPTDAIKADMEGDSYILWRIDTSGMPQDCRVLKSSGHETLDRKACAVVTERARFVPARDKAGQAVDAYMSRSLRWRLPTF